MARSSGGLLFEHHYGKLPARFFLIVAIGRIQLDHLLPESRSLLACCYTCAGAEVLIRNLHLDQRVRQQIQIPSGMCVCTALGTHDNVGVLY